MAFNPDSYFSAPASQLPGTSPTEDPAPLPSLPSVPQTATSTSSGFDPDRYFNKGHATDQLTGAQVPLAYSGNTPETAMNKNALSATDRMNLSLGNEKGNIAYLKEKFPDARPMTGPDGKPTGELAYKQGSTWYRVNPKNGDISDPWEKTKEYMKDAASLAPEALGAAVAAGTGILSDGMSLPASAAIAGGTAAAVRTSLGRLIGTYDATPSEQAWDVGFESLLNAAGAKVLAGVKPTAGWVAGKLKPLAEAFKDAVEPMEGGAWANTTNPAKVLFKKIMTTLSVNEREFNVMADQPETVGSKMSELYSKNGKDVIGYHDDAIAQQTGHIANIANDTRSALSQIYGSMRNKLLAKVPDEFSVNLEDSVYASYKSALDSGIGKITVAGKDMTGKDAIEYLAKNGTSKAGFSILTPDELQRSIMNGGSVGSGAGYLSANPEAHAILDSFYKNMGKFAGGADRTGVQGAKDLLDFKKTASDLARDASMSPALQNSFDVRSIINSSKSAIDDDVFQALKKVGAHEDFTNLNSTYDRLSQGLAPLLNAQKQAVSSGTTKPYASLLNSFLARPSPTATARGAIDDAISAASANGLDMLGQSLAASKNSIQVLEAAKAFNPLKSSQLKANALQNLTQLLQQPVIAQKSLATVQGLAKAQEMLSSMTKTQVSNLLDNPQAIQSFTAGMLQAPAARAQADQATQQMLQMVTQRPQQQQQVPPPRRQGR